MLLPSLLGNEPVKAAISAISGNALGAAILIDGPFGSGKKTAAQDLAKAILCSGAPAPCGKCSNCVHMQAGTHPDYHVLPYDGKAVKLEQVREMRAASFIKPSEANVKVFVIHAADKLNPQSQNALLKVLEEPASSVFILLCENKEAMLQTVRSRCIALRMEPLSDELLTQQLRARTQASETQIAQAIAVSGGFLGQALDFLNGSETAADTVARNFVQALDDGELAIFEQCTAVSALSRDEFAAFCDKACVLLRQEAYAYPQPRLISIYEYIESQKAMLVQNPSVAALAGALSVFCSTH